MLAVSELEKEKQKDSMNTLETINILLVDDRKEDLLALELILGNENYTFVKATSGREAKDTAEAARFCHTSDRYTHATVRRL